MVETRKTNKKNSIEKDKNREDNEKQKNITYYDILNVAQTASDKEIKASFRKLVMQFHPDNKETGDASLFALVARAYETMSDKSKRSEYDNLLKIEKMAQESSYVNQKKAFDDFIKAQEEDIKNPENRNKADTGFRLAFEDLDRRVGFDRDMYNQERDNPIKEKEVQMRLENLERAREQDEIENMPKKMFDANFDPARFNALFEAKFKDSLVPFTDDPFSFNDNGVIDGNIFTTTGDYENTFDEESISGNNTFASIDGAMWKSVYVTDDDVKRLKTMEGSYDYKGHKEISKSYETELEKRLREREQDDAMYEKRTVDQFETDINKGFGILNKVGLLGGEIDWADAHEDISMKAYNKLLKYNAKQK